MVNQKEYFKKYPLTKEEKKNLPSKRVVREDIKQFRQNVSSNYLQPQRNIPVRNVKFIQTLNPAPSLTQEQNMLQELFNGERTFGTGQNLPNTEEQALRSGGGLINNGDGGETGSMFGLRRNSYGFNGEGGY